MMQVICLSFLLVLSLLFVPVVSRQCTFVQRNPVFLIVRGGANTEASSTFTLPPELNLTIHEDLLTQDECDTIIRIARPFLRPSKVGRPPRVEPSLRISNSCKLPRLPIPQLWAVERKLAHAASVPIERGEDLQVGSYHIGHYYGMHCDERAGGRPHGGGRLATALAYLNTLDSSKATGGCTVFSGRRFVLPPGELDFPRGDGRVRELKRLCNDCTNEKATRVSPRQGRVITFRNLAPAIPPGTGDVGANKEWKFIPESTHGACEVVNTTNPPACQKDEGATKFVVQQWFGLEMEVNVARHSKMLAHVGLGVANSYNVDSMADLGSPTGQPKAEVVGDNATVTNASWLNPSIGATRVRGWCAGINAAGQEISTHDSAIGNGVSAAVWFQLGKETINDEHEHRIFRVGPHELLVNAADQLEWAAGNETTSFENIQIQRNQWYHVALVISAPSQGSDGKVTMNAELYLSEPGRPPSAPFHAQLCLGAKPEWRNGVSIGGCRKGYEGPVDLTATDFYAIGEEMKGKGHSFAFAISFYDPNQGI